MHVIMKLGATDAHINAVIKKAEDFGLGTKLIQGEKITVIALMGSGTSQFETTDMFEGLDGVSHVERVRVPFVFASREVQPQDSVIHITPDLKIGGSQKDLIVMSGPCSVESEDGILITARAVKKAGATILRGGAFKPRTAPRTFEGLGKKGLELLKLAKQETGLPIVTELMDIRDLEDMLDVADIIQIGARNMQNFPLLNEVGRIDKPVLLKRGMSSTIEEWLLAAERIMHHGNHKVILCERGIRSFDSKYTRNVLDMAAVPVIKELSHLPIIVDTSHSTGKRSLVRSMSLSAVASGADGLMIETHPDPANALSDGPQSLTFEQFEKLMAELQEVQALANKLYRQEANDMIV